MNIVVNDVALSFPEAATKEKEGIVKTTEDIQLNQEHTALRASGLGELNQIADGFINATTVAPPLIRLPFLNCQTVNYGVPFSCEVICPKSSTDGIFFTNLYVCNFTNFITRTGDGTYEADPDLIATGWPIQEWINLERHRSYNFNFSLELAKDKEFKDVVFKSYLMKQWPRLSSPEYDPHPGEDADNYVLFKVEASEASRYFNEYVLEPDCEYFVRARVLYGAKSIYANDDYVFIPNSIDEIAIASSVSSFKTLPLSQIGTVELKLFNYFNPNVKLWGEVVPPYQDFSLDVKTDGFVPDSEEYQFDLKIIDTVTQETKQSLHYDNYAALKADHIHLNEIGSFLFELTITHTDEDGTQLTGQTSVEFKNNELAKYYPAFSGTTTFAGGATYTIVNLNMKGETGYFLSLVPHSLSENVEDVGQEINCHLVWYAEDKITILAEYDSVVTYMVYKPEADENNFAVMSCYVDYPTAEQLNLRKYGGKTIYLYGVQQDTNRTNGADFQFCGQPSDDLAARQKSMLDVFIPQRVADKYPSSYVNPGEMGFGVGPYPGDDLADLGLQAMDGTDDPKSAYFGNYERIDGKGVMVFIPAFCYSFEPSEIPSNVTSSSGFGFKWFSEFDYNEQKANDAGYILHEAFLDGTDTKSGFFIAKYLMSKGIKSVKGGIPISLCSSGSDVPSIAEGHGATGQAWDALTLSKTWGTGYNCASVYMYSALAMLSLVHGWHAKSTDVCAWYDAEGTTNYPKGCNNNMLGDCDDTTVLYSHGDRLLPNKPNTGSANQIDKTTHNGRISGVCDLNGCINEVAIGFILHGSTWYLRATNAKLVDYTKDNVNTTDSTVYRSTSLFIGDKQGYWGKNSINVFFTEKNGDQRTLCGVVPNNNAQDGTNEFGNDRAYWYYSGDNFCTMLCGGYWLSSSRAGIWNRYALADNSDYHDWDDSVASWGFRCAAYGNK